LQRAQFSIAFIPPENAHATGPRWDFRWIDQLFLPYTALRAVKDIEEQDELHGDLTRQCGKALVTMTEREKERKRVRERKRKKEKKR
jgi:hypothetical protein